MEKSRFKFYQKILIVSGSATLAASHGLPNYWGNLTVYVNSYFLSCMEGVPLTPWIISIFNIFRIVCLIVASTFQDGSRPWIPLVGIVVTILGAFSTYFSVQSSMEWVIATVGVVFGLGTGIVNAWIMKLLVDSFDENLGFMNSVVGASTSGGAMLINEFVTQYINPLNQQPNFDFAGSKYFTQKDIVDKTPSTFLIFGGYVMATQILGFSLISVALHIIPNYHGERLSLINGKDFRPEQNAQRRLVNSKDTPQEGKGKDILQKNVHQQASTPTQCRSENMNSFPQSEAVQSSNMRKQFTTKEVLKSRVFYALWISFIFAEFPFLLVNNFYKVFGQVRINDDHFLTFIGTARTFCNIWGRLFWGAVMDRIGVKNNLMIVLFLAVLASFWYYFTPLVDKWLYLVVTMLFGNFASGYYSSYLVVSVMTFGKANAASNLGLIRSSGVASNLLVPLLFEALIVHSGWFFTFVMTGVVNIISLTILKLALPCN